MAQHLGYLTIQNIAVTEAVHAAKVHFWLEYDTSDEKCDPTLSLLITSSPFMKTSQAPDKKIQGPHIWFRECNISITNVSAELQREVEKATLIDVTLYEKKILTARPTFLIGFRRCQLPFLSILHLLNPRPLHDESRTNLLTLILSPRLA